MNYYSSQSFYPTSTYVTRRAPDGAIWNLLDRLLRDESPQEQFLLFDGLVTPSDSWQISLRVSDEPRAILALAAIGIALWQLCGNSKDPSCVEKSHRLSLLVLLPEEVMIDRCSLC